MSVIMDDPIPPGCPRLVSSLAAQNRPVFWPAAASQVYGCATQYRDTQWVGHPYTANLQQQPPSRRMTRADRYSTSDISDISAIRPARNVRSAALSVSSSAF